MFPASRESFIESEPFVKSVPLAAAKHVSWSNGTSLGPTGTTHGLHTEPGAGSHTLGHTSATQYPSGSKSALVERGSHKEQQS